MMVTVDVRSLARVHERPKDLHHDTLYHVGIGLPDKAAVIDAYHRAVAFGAPVEEPPRTTWRGTPLHKLWLTDPDGTLIEVYARLTDAELATMPPIRRRSIWCPEPNQLPYQVPEVACEGKDVRMPPDQKHKAAERGTPRRWRLEERLEASGPRRRWFATLAGLVAIVSIWRGMWLLMDLFLLPSSPMLSSIVSIGAGIVLLLAAGLSLEDAA